MGRSSDPYILREAEVRRSRAVLQHNISTDTHPWVAALVANRQVLSGMPDESDGGNGALNGGAFDGQTRGWWTLTWESFRRRLGRLGAPISDRGEIDR
jgi:hypothetical protein